MLPVLGLGNRSLSHPSTHCATAVGTSRTVIDDFHWIEDERSSQACTYFLEHLPAHIHLYIESNGTAVPTAKRNLHELVIHLNNNDLHFDVRETVQCTRTLPPAVWKMLEESVNTQVIEVMDVRSNIHMRGPFLRVIEVRRFEE